MKREELTEERHRLLERLVNYFKNIEGIRGIFVAGSLPAGRADEWSDIDARIIINPANYETVLSGRLTHPQNWGDFMFNQWHEHAIHCVSHFRPFNKVDVFYYSSDQLSPSPWFTLPIAIYFDPDNIVSKLIENSKDMEFSPTSGEVDRLIGMTIATAHEIYRRAQRGELFYAQYLLNNFRILIVEGNNFLRKSPFENVERSAPEHLRSILSKSYVPLNRQEILKALRTLAPAFEQQIQKLHEVYKLDRSLSTDIESLSIVLNCNDHE